MGRDCNLQYIEHISTEETDDALKITPSSRSVPLTHVWFAGTKKVGETVGVSVEDGVVGSNVVGDGVGDDHVSGEIDGASVREWSQ